MCGRQEEEEKVKANFRPLACEAAAINILLEF